MNDLSWMLYWADVLPSLSVTVTVLSAVSGLAAIILVPTVFIIGEDDGWSVVKRGVRAIRYPLYAWLALLAAAQFVPSRDTFYAIAASEMGEEALKSPIASKAGKALENWLDQQLADEKGEAK